ncbi:hypothetical protein SDC9_102537 [bioreactor metagenome]|uniref:Uncharacterized protein n=1 Tax=bioreactor metagenome TaxID=1076179 RepID=A0A645ARL3_9ZZZZ
MHPCLGVDQQTDMRGRGIGHQHRHRERADPPQALLALDVPLIERGHQAADTAADRNAQPLGINRVLLAEAESGIGPCLAGGYHRELADAVHPAGLNARDPLRDVRVDLTGDLHGQILSPVSLDMTDAAAPGEKCLPGGGRIISQWGDGSESCDDNVSH